jgi:preprotein translocase subunit YajC
LRKIRIFSLGIIGVLVAAIALATGCLPTTTGTGTDSTTTGSSTTSFLIMIGFIVVLFGLMYFLTIRPQRKRQQEQMKMLQAIQKGDRVVTIGGLYGTVESTDENSVVLKVESGALMRFLRSAIASKVTDQPPQFK